VESVAEAYGAPSWVTVHEYANVPGWPGSKTVLVRLIGVPTGLLSGALLIVGIGATLVTVMMTWLA